MTQINLENYLSNGVEKIVKGILKASLRNPKASLFMMQYGKSSKRAGELRRGAEVKGEHVPPFLIASITTTCNLHCAGCYARANDSCSDTETTSKLLSSQQWGSIFEDAAHMGVQFILLAGGEPFMRKDVLLEAGKHRDILFPIFTNGTMIDENYINILTENRNLLPVLSIEGSRETTDSRRGKGIYDELISTMEKLKKEGILFGASITVHKNNMEEVMSDEFISTLKDKDCKAVVYVEYVPIDKVSKDIAIDDDSRRIFDENLNRLRMKETDMVFIAFPGDEKSSGGCLAAGRGFFHINAFGGAEPCPFSPYSDTNVTDISLREALKSPLFVALRDNGNLTEEHVGGCALFEQEDKVVEILMAGKRGSDLYDHQG